jgi:hypothetical protein
MTGGRQVFHRFGLRLKQKTIALLSKKNVLILLPFTVTCVCELRFFTLTRLKTKEMKGLK